MKESDVRKAWDDTRPTGGRFWQELNYEERERILDVLGRLHDRPCDCEEE